MNKLFSISKSAAEKIAVLCTQSNCAEPVASLGEVGETTTSNEKLANAVRSNAKDFDLLQLAKEAVVQDRVAYKLIVVVNERRDCDLADLVFFDGIEFAMPNVIRSALGGYCLEFSLNGFELKSADRTIHNLRDVEKYSLN